MPTQTHHPDASDAAKQSGLVYVSDAKPGIQRVKTGDGFRYKDAKGYPIKDAKTLARIKSLAIPPAYTNVWISPNPKGHIQATGLDARGRKQYRYHPKWRTARDETKYGRMADFGNALAGMRTAVAADLKKQGLPREKVLATVVTLLEKTLIRVGNEAYARDNKSFGLTTLRNRHVRVRGAKVNFAFLGKSKVRHTISVSDARLARVVARLRDLPGQHLFQYQAGDGKEHAVTSSEVNAYIKQISGQDFSAKDFRTWAGTVLALDALAGLQPPTSVADGKRNVVKAVCKVADQLGNTPSVCRKSYIYPLIIDAYMDGSLQPMLAKLKPKPVEGLSGEETRLLDLVSALSKDKS